ncbi:MAG: alpha/beta fold hydrolase [Gordonia sp. (in: high G+C Gram-positive bacteria)]
MTRRKVAYGPDRSQYGHLYLPAARDARAPLVVLVHGGSWSTEFALVVESAVARDLAARGAVVWNVEYRRVEEDGGGWPGTGRDVVDALRALDGPVAERLAVAGVKIDRNSVAVVGHSAGGQLAVWAVARLGAATERHRITTVIPQSAVLDFTVDGVRDKPSVVGLMGRPYPEAVHRYREASPALLDPFDATVEVVHTVDDQAVPVELSRHYVREVTARGQRARLHETPGDHAAFVDPRSAAHRQTLRLLGL